MSRIPTGFGGGKNKVPPVKVVPSKQTKKPVSSKAPTGPSTREPHPKRKHDANVVIEDLTRTSEGAPHKKNKAASTPIPLIRSEERRVGKEC